MKGKSYFILFLILIATGVLIAINAMGVPALSNRYNEDGTMRFVWGVRNIRQGLDLQGGVSILYEADTEVTHAEISAAQALLRGRLDRRGYTEAVVALEGGRQIRVDIPGVEDAAAAVAEIGATALLTFLGDNEVMELIQNHGAVFVYEGDREFIRYANGDRFDLRLIADVALLTGANVDSAYSDVSAEQRGPYVGLNFDSEGARLFEAATAQNVGRSLSIFMDDERISVANVSEAIRGGRATITGQMTVDRTRLLASQITQGSLPFRLDVIQENLVGARLGSDALRTSIIAGAIGFLLVLVFMAIFYRTMGICADIALIIYVGLVLFIVSIPAFGITLSLPGIAGLILSVGMATDANIVIFERIREEVALGKTLRSAMRTGYRRALPAIVDSNVTTLIAGAVLFWLGTGPIMGFAQMLIIGIVASMFTCLVVTRIITDCLMEVGLVKTSHILSDKQKTALDEARANNKSEAELEVDVKPIVEKRKVYFTFSAAILTFGLMFMIGHASFGTGFFDLDVEFSGGTSFEFDVGQAFDNNEIEEIVRSVTGESAPQVQPIIGTNQVMIRTTTAQDEADTRQELINRLAERYDIAADDIQYSFVSPAVSAAMRSSAVLAILISGLAMLVYISLRFRDIRTGASAVIAQMHDALVVLCVYGIFRIPLNYAFIAVMLTTLGYSINATIIIFDRIRENRVRMPKASYTDLINTSVSQTLRRTLFSTASSLIAVFMLYVIGVAAIRDFTLPIIVGLFFGAYSSVCLSGSAWYLMIKGKKQ